ncbi:MAG: RluA family pseudouridine synthase [Pirellulales bacterium]|nr:RluA family pseudouridine synthase [Pirellulales bacterium]
MPPLSSQPVELTVQADEAGWRLDAFLARHFTDYSRVHLRRVITAGGVQIDGRGGKPAYRLLAGQRVVVVLPEIPREAPRPENIPLEILYEDEHFAAVNKPAGMVVHPARGHWTGTLAGALQYRFGGTLSGGGGPSRPGIVHRLDRDTSGVILVARNDAAQYRLARQFAERSIEKEYFAIVCGVPERDRDWIDSPIGFHPHVREMMAIRRDDPSSRAAATFYEVLERFPGDCPNFRGGENGTIPLRARQSFTTLKILPKTGRTHQIRVHLNHLGFPVLCDRQYGGRSQITRGELRGDPADAQILLARQALHARRIKFCHPADGRVLEIEAPLPVDIEAVLNVLRKDRS